MTDTQAPPPPIRVCDICGGVDDHPRHSFVWMEGGVPNPDPAIVQKVQANSATLDGETQARLMADLFDTFTQERHMDCCRDSGCPDGSCDIQTAGVKKLKGDALREHLVSLPATDWNENNVNDEGFDLNAAGE